MVDTIRALGRGAHAKYAGVRALGLGLAVLLAGCASTPRGAGEARRYYDERLAGRTVPMLEEVIRFPTVQGNTAARDAQQSWLMKTAEGLGFAGAGYRKVRRGRAGRSRRGSRARARRARRRAARRAEGLVDSTVRRHLEGRIRPRPRRGRRQGTARAGAPGDESARASRARAHPSRSDSSSEATRRATTPT